ncbi:MAG: hypothetical protein ABW199_06215 [Caulobacterales bacterium]
MRFERAHIIDAFRFWETARGAYNLILLTIVVAAAFLDIGGNINQAMRWLGLLPGFVVLAVVANILYCAAYPVDLLFQTSQFRAQWIQARWFVWTLGVAFSVALALLALFGMAFALPF